MIHEMRFANIADADTLSASDLEAARGAHVMNWSTAEGRNAAVGTARGEPPENASS